MLQGFLGNQSMLSTQLYMILQKKDFEIASHWNLPLIISYNAQTVEEGRWQRLGQITKFYWKMNKNPPGGRVGTKLDQQWARGCETWA